MWASSTISHIPPYAGDRVTGSRDEVVRHAVRLELAAVRVRRPRRREAGLLDRVDGWQVLEPHRLDRRPSPVVARPCHRLPSAARTPRGSVTYSGTSVSSSSASRRRASRAAPSARRARARARRPRRLAALERHRPGPVRQVDRDERLARSRAAGSVAAAAAAPAARPARTTSRSDGPGRQQQHVERASARRGCREQGLARSTRPTSGIPRPWASPLAVAIPTRSPVKAPGPVPTTMPASRERRMFCSPRNRPIDGSSVSPWR